MNYHDILKIEIENESICPECSSIMDEVKVSKSNRYKKESTYYECEVCGHKARKRTFNETLRDCGFKN